MLTYQDPRCFLLIPPLLLLLLWATRPGYSGLPIRALLGTFVLRLATLVCILAALAGTAYVQQSDRVSVIFVVDVSRSMTSDMQERARRYVQSALATKGPTDVAGVIVFARDARAVAAPSALVQHLRSLGAGGVERDATDLEHALRLATTLFPSDRAKKIVLLSDGAETAGDVQALEPSLEASHIVVDVADILPADKTRPPEALLLPLSPPSHVSARVPFTLSVHAWSSQEQSAALTLQGDGRTLARRSVRLPAGESVWNFTQTMGRPGARRYDVALSATRDTLTENNAVYGVVRASGSVRILYLTSDTIAGNELRDLLAPSGVDVVVQTPEARTVDLARLSQFDGVIVGDATANEIGVGAMLAIQSAAQNHGIGFGMIGGERGFAAGGYAGTPLAEALPVEMDRKANPKTPNAAIVVALDASGSMARLEDGVQKLQLGAKAAIQLMHTLKPDDQIAVTAVREQTQVILPMQAAANTQPLEDAVDGMNAGGGGIYCRTALEDADAMLKGISAPVRHVILVADTSDSEQPEGCIALTQRMKRAGITVSVVGIGSETDRDVAFQRALANAGGGQSVIAEEAEALPALFVRDTQQLQANPYLERTASLSASGTAPMLSGLPLTSMPPILGYDFVRAKTGASTALATSDSQETILAYGRYGQGRTFAFASDGAAHWTEPWADWRGRRAFWSQLIRWFASPPQDDGVGLHIEENAGAGQISITVPRGKDIGDYEAFATSPDLTSRAISLTPTDARSAEGSFEMGRTGAYSVTISSRSGKNGSKSALLVVPYSPEFLRARPDRPRLIQLASACGGVFAQPPGRVFHDHMAWVTAGWNLTPLLLLLSAFCFLGELAWRTRALRAPK